MDNKNDFNLQLEDNQGLPPTQVPASAPAPAAPAQPAAPQMPKYEPVQPLAQKPIRTAPQRSIGFKILTFFVILIAIASIFGLAFLFYYFATTSPASQFAVSYNTQPSTDTANQNQQAAAVPTTPATKVVSFAAPVQLPTDKKDGSCWTNSLAQPYRKDAWRCVSGNSTYDPCFETGQANTLFCQMNPLVASSFVLNLTSPLPVLQTTITAKDNWAWFLTLSDGTICSPFTGTKPKVGDDMATFGCKAPDATHQIMLVGDLVKGNTWTAKKVTLEKQGTIFMPTTTETVNIDTVWQ